MVILGLPKPEEYLISLESQDPCIPMNNEGFNKSLNIRGYDFVTT